MQLPIYLAILGWIIGIWAIFFPVCYLVFWKLTNKNLRRASLFQVFGISFVFLIHLTYLYHAWDYGVKWQGYSHTVWVTTINVALFTILSLCAYFSWKHASESMTRATTIAIFVVLSWFAFPYLGELP